MLKIACILALKRVFFQTEYHNIKQICIQQLVQISLDLRLKASLRAVALRACIEIRMISGEQGLICEMEERMRSDGRYSHNLILRVLLYKKNESYQYIEQMNLSWYCLTGIPDSNYYSELERIKNNMENDNSIRLECTDGEYSNDVMFLDECLRSFMKNVTKSILVLSGESGCGKTSSCIKLTYELMITKSEYFPIFIYLPSISNFESFIEEHLVKMKLNDDIIHYRKVVFIFDSLDELTELPNVCSSWSNF